MAANIFLTLINSTFSSIPTLLLLLFMSDLEQTVEFLHAVVDAIIKKCCMLKM